LRDKGVLFENYNLPNLKTVNGILNQAGEKVAWFKDPSGNILSISSKA
jgi:hypothetical protein